MNNTAGTIYMSRAEYDALSPKMKGYACYMFGARPQAGEYLKKCPFDEIRQPMEHSEFRQGEFAAMLYCQECEE
jgi:hypothetical protein